MPGRILLPLLLLPSLALAQLEIGDAWIQNLPASIPVRAGYLTLTNPKQQNVKIVALRSEDFTRIEIHRSVMRDGTMRMEPQPALDIGAGETLRLAPGGLHLMMHPVEPTRPGETYRISIDFDDGTTQTIEMTVRK